MVEVAGGWRRLQNKDLHNLQASTYYYYYYYYYYCCDQIKGDVFCWACSTGRRDDECIKYFGWKTLREETTWKIILEWILGI